MASMASSASSVSSASFRSFRGGFTHGRLAGAPPQPQPILQQSQGSVLVCFASPGLKAQLASFPELEFFCDHAPASGRSFDISTRLWTHLTQGPRVDAVILCGLPKLFARGHYQRGLCNTLNEYVDRGGRLILLGMYLHEHPRLLQRLIRDTFELPWTLAPQKLSNMDFFLCRKVGNTASTANLPLTRCEFGGRALLSNVPKEQIIYAAQMKSSSPTGSHKTTDGFPSAAAPERDVQLALSSVALAKYGLGNVGWFAAGYQASRDVAIIKWMLGHDSHMDEAPLTRNPYDGLYLDFHGIAV